jgi:PIN domain nuclease of toxin-antitoxin system
MTDPRDEVRDRRLAFALDASALLAYLFGEPGGQLVADVLEHSAMSAVNWTEVMQCHHRLGIPAADLRAELRMLGFGVVDFTVADSERTAAMWGRTHRLGLSLGDRACLAFAASLDLRVLTADRAWRELDLGVKVDLIR